MKTTIFLQVLLLIIFSGCQVNKDLNPIETILEYTATVFETPKPVEVLEVPFGKFPIPSEPQITAFSALALPVQKGEYDQVEIKTKTLIVDGKESSVEETEAFISLYLVNKDYFDNPNSETIKELGVFSVKPEATTIIPLNEGWELKEEIFYMVFEAVKEPLEPYEEYYLHFEAEVSESMGMKTKILTVPLYDFVWVDTTYQMLSIQIH